MLNEHKVIKIYFTIKELMQLTGFSYQKIHYFIKVKVSYNKCNHVIRIHRNDLNKYFNFKL